MTDSDTRQLLCFAIGSSPCAVWADCFGSMQLTQQVRSSGVVRYREESFPLVDVLRQLHLRPSTKQKSELVLVAERDIRAALLVPLPTRLVNVSTRSLRSVPAIYPAAERRRWQGLVIIGQDRVLPVLSLEEVRREAT